jgi:hypothetical protein
MAIGPVVSRWRRSRSRIGGPARRDWSSVPSPVLHIGNDGGRHPPGAPAARHAPMIPRFGEMS